MRNTTHIISSILVILALGVGIFFRVWGLPDYIPFFGDQGIDLLASLRIVRGEFYPSIGPSLSVDNYITPPTYYYYIAALLKLFGSEVALVYVLGLLNIISGVLFAIVLKKKTDTLTASIFFFLYMVLFSSIQQAKTVWNPYAATAFSAFSLWLFLAEERFKLWKYIAGILTAIISATMYPTGLLLVPVYMYYGFCYLHTKYTDRRDVFFINIVSFFIVFYIVCRQYLLYEIRSGFPFIVAILGRNSDTNAFATISLFSTPLEYISHAAQLFDHMIQLFIPYWYQYPLMQRLYPTVVVFVVLWIISQIILLRKHIWSHISAKFFSDLGFPFVLVGCIPFLFLNSFVSDTTYRVLVFLPYVLFCLALLIRTTIFYADIKIMAFTIVLGMVLLYVNIVATIRTSTAYQFSRIQNYGDVTQLYLALIQDIHRRNLDVHDVDFHVITKHDEWSYEATPLWYLLKKYHNYDIPMNKVGNDTVRSQTIAEDKDHAYIICFPDFLMRDSCWQSFFLHNSSVLIEKEFVVQPYYIYFVIKK